MKRFSDIKLIILVCTGVTVFLNSCLSDVDLLNVSKDIQIDQSLVIPVGEAKLTISDIFRKFGLPGNIDPLSNEIYFQNSISTEYTFKPINLADSVKPFTKTLSPFPGGFTYPANIPITIPPISDTLGLGINGNISQQRIDTLKMSSGLINVTVDATSDIQQIPAGDIHIEFVLDKLKVIDGTKLTFVPTQYSVAGQIKLGAFSIFANGAAKIPLKINVTINTQSKSIPLGANPQITIKLSFVNLILAEARGKFPVSLANTQTMPFNIADIVPNGYLKFDDPTLTIKATSNLGVDALIKLDYLKTYNLNSATNFQLAWFNGHTTNSTSLILNGPTIPGKKDSVSFDPFNSINGEIDKLINTNPYPNTLEYKYTVTNNPESKRMTDFITDNNTIKFDLITRMKLSFKAGSSYNLTDTIQNVGQSIGSVLNSIDSAILVLNISNGLPVKAVYRMTFCKSNTPNDTISRNITTIKDNTLTGNIFSSYQLIAPEINADGTVKTDGLKSQTLLIGLNKNTIEDLKRTKFIVYTLIFEGDQSTINGVSTTNPFHFTIKNSFGIKMGIFVKNKTTLAFN